MTFDQFEQAWKKETPGPGPDELGRILPQIEREGRSEAILQNTCLAITAICALALGIRFSRDNLGHYLLECAAWVTLVILIRRRAERLRRIRRLHASLRDAVTMALRDTRERISEMKRAGVGIFVLCAVLLGPAVYHLHSTGRMDGRSVVRFAELFGAVLLVSAIGWTVHYRRSLRPRRERLESIVASFEEPHGV